MTSLRFMKHVFLLAVLLIGGCKISDPNEATKEGTLRFHNWWNYYEAGKWKSDIGDFYGARSDFETCLGLRPGATYALPKEMWRVRTYGLHMLDAYFPHRELGITLFQLGDMKKAEQYLEKSLLQEPSGRAKYYLNLVRKKLVASQPLLSPQLILDKNVTYKWTQQRKRVVSGLAQSQAFVSGIQVNEQSEFIELAERAIWFEREIQLSEGTNIVRIKVTDLADQVFSRSLVWYADWQPPQIVIKRVDTSGQLWKVQGVCYDDNGLASLNTDGHAQTFLESDRVVSIPLEFAMTRDQSIVVFAEDLAGNHVQAVLSARALATRFPLGGKQFASTGVGGVPLDKSNVEAVPDTPPSWDSTDTLAPTVQLSNPSAVIQVFDSEYFLDGYVSDGSGLASVTINGEELLRREDRGARLRYLSRSLPLDLETNTFTLISADLAGNRITHSFVVVRKVPEYLDVEYRLKTGITPFTGVEERHSPEAIQRQMEMEMIREPIRFHLLERGPEEWNFIMQEQRLSLSDLADPQSALRIGKMLPADVLMIGSIINEGRGVTIFVKGVETEKGISLCSEDVYIEGNREQFMYGIHGLALKIKQRFPLVEGKVLQVIDDEVIIDKGALDGLRAGMKFIVTSNRDQEESTQENKVMKVDENIVELKVATVSKSRSVATILPSAAKSLLKPGQRIYAR